VLIISYIEAMKNILDAVGPGTSDRHPRYACYLGAGASFEAGVKMADEISSDLRAERLQDLQLAGVQDDEHIKEMDQRLHTDDRSLRYMYTLQDRYPDLTTRVDYFRRLLKGVTPAFCHHALALLISHRYIKTSCLTTNFDKLLESAFTQQAENECQAIRTDDELRFWTDREDRHYVLKLHGDCETQNISNTTEETVSISDAFRGATFDLLNSAGLVVIGSAGNEKSIHTLFDSLSQSAAKGGQVLQYGLLWGVYVGEVKPQKIDDKAVQKAVESSLNDAVSPEIVRMIERMQSKRLFRFFPMWGAGRFFYDLIRLTENRAVIGTAERYLDRKMRLRKIFSEAGLSDVAITKHLSTLEPKRTHMGGSSEERRFPELTCSGRSKSGKVEVRVLYGDITSRTFMSSEQFSRVRRAIISPDDTFITAGGGVAEGLLLKADRQFMLNELGKFAPISHGAIAVTSAGNLPVHYVFHAAAIKVQEGGVYAVSKESVRDAMTASLSAAALLQVAVLWAPLMGTGAAGLAPAVSFCGILEAIAEAERRNVLEITVLICIYKHSVLEKHDVEASMINILGSQFDFSWQAGAASSCSSTASSVPS